MFTIEEKIEEILHLIEKWVYSGRGRYWINEDTQEMRKELKPLLEDLVVQNGGPTDESRIRNVN